MTSIEMGDKLYAVIRADLPPGPQMAQLGHAISEFWQSHRELAEEWHNQSNFICILHTDDEHSLTRLLIQARSNGIPHAQFREPDYDDELTAIVIHPTGKHLVRHLPLAFATN